MNGVRALALCAVTAAFALTIASHDEAFVLFVGLSPLLWLALEGVYRLLDDQRPAGAGADDRRTGMRREPNGLPNFW